MFTQHTVSLTSAQILASNATAITALAPELGFTNVVKQVRVRRQKGSTNTTQYATNTSMKLKFSGGDDIATINLSTLPATSAATEVVIPVSHTALSNTAIVLQTDTGNPATGNIPIDVIIEFDKQI